MKYLIIGGVAGGATVAARLRRMDEKAEIILFERGKYVSYANCGLPYYIGDTINDRNKLFVQTVKGFTDRFRIDIRTEQEATQILPESTQVEVKKLGTGETYTETYDKLVLSPGAEPLRPRIEGIESKKIFTLRNVPDTDTIKNYVNTEKPRTAPRLFHGRYRTSAIDRQAGRLDAGRWRISFRGDFQRRDRSFEKREADPGGYGFIEYRCPSGNPIGQGSGTYDRSTRRYRCQ